MIISECDNAIIDERATRIRVINDNLGLILDNLALSTLEDNLSDAWLKCLNRDIYSFRVTSIFNSLLKEAAHRFKAEVILVDVEPNLGAINRVITISSDYVIIPVASDLFSLQGIKNLGSTLFTWQMQWIQ